MARRRKYIDRKLLKALCKAQLTDNEIATALRVDRTTLWRRYATAIKAWKEDGVASLRRKLFVTAQGDDKGAVTAMIFFLKNYGGMSDGPKEKRELDLGDLPISQEFHQPRKADKPN